ncbi:Ribosome-releasing factor [Anaerohalosphaera lusitana]|uniref:Ribosome-recycling factor n=1 Tax=Anaerohalosphaera lusitana TaxID=1936003 RepID=A0A1U9NQJ1_9BACT|nr:ribosome recycling factor [Anaerohalosphaera lusitana]AQT70179.1 Ribosome-releasing factor [Anaerohalosphaera lusitana]
MPVQNILAEHEDSMKKSIDFLHTELKGVRTGRASTGLVEHVRVDYYGSPTPLNQLATISTPDATSIVIKPFDPGSLKDIEKAIKVSDLGLPPIADGKVVRLSIPPLSGERREQLVQQVKQMGEQTKISIRNIRRDANKQLDDEEKSKDITEDDRDRGKKEVDEITKKYTEEVDSVVKAKSEEIMEQ